MPGVGRLFLGVSLCPRCDLKDGMSPSFIVEETMGPLMCWKMPLVLDTRTLLFETHMAPCAYHTVFSFYCEYLSCCSSRSPTSSIPNEPCLQTQHGPDIELGLSRNVRCFWVLPGMKSLMLAGLWEAYMLNH